MRPFNDYPPIMGAASAGNAGRKGLVPAPAAGQQTAFLRGDRTWGNPGSNFIGGVAGASVPATATAAGDYYLITSAGTSQSKTWAVGDRAVYNGVSGSWTQIPAQALTAYTAPSAITGAGNTNLALGVGNQFLTAKMAVNAGTGAYTATVTLQNTNAIAGAEIEGQVSVAASTNPLVEIRNLTSGGTLLGAITGDSVARIWNFRAVYDGTNWFLTALGLPTKNIPVYQRGGGFALWGDSLAAGLHPALQEMLGATIYNGAVGGETSTQIRTRMVADTARHALPTIIWAGRNNYASPTTVKNDIAAMVAALGHDRYLILGIPNGDYTTYERSGGAGYSLITTLNSDLLALYGERFLDLRAPLVSLRDVGQSQDVQDYMDDILPTSLRSDTIHPNAAGNYAIASMVVAAWARAGGFVGSRIAEAVRNAFANPPVLGATTPKEVWCSKIGTRRWSQIVGSGVTVDLFSVEGYALSCAGFMTVKSHRVVGAGMTIRTYAVAVMGSGLVGGVVQLSSEDYGAGAGAFVISETRDSPAGGSNKVSFTNSLPDNTVMTATLLLFQNDGTVTYY
jgi:hypothetical protein